jgi:DnaJ-class molecular chaperone
MGTEPEDKSALGEWEKKIQRAFEALEASDYYKVLSVPHDAGMETIRRAYYTRAQQLHPDRVRHFGEPVRSQAVAIFKRVAEAYQTLSDPELRRAYDQALEEGRKRLIVSDRLVLKPKTEFDFLTTEAGKNYYVAAKEAVAKGNGSAAKLNIRLAIQYEGEKKELLDLKAKIDKM